MLRLFILLLAMALPMTALAVEPDEMLDDPVLEARAREVSKGLRCVVCLNQDIDSSNAGVARDLRLLVRERIMAGDTNEEATAFIQARYGDYVLLRPPLNAKTYVLWFAPPTLLIIGVGVGWMTLLRRRRKPVQNKLSEAEEQEIKQFIDDQKAGEST
ncbi:cytochrome c-type biogenesis protein CcmH [Aliiroseovarius sediminilitoris]|uniref:Cytochrome c-type biogenesis protein n=1 Tax=Aliiroseovarius sediminilitoris TaxID=1173584 RepID=A0A1I0R5P3_9RHOB|nr:cytochrome c-type biogenesis protein [Aliiroseovarius sediminilitoris]SEW35335.1 cytochrome c-type biogenesis protein CcmH [Aliiroseovarius sediminilitoris]